MKRDASKLRRETGCSLSDAAAALELTNGNREHAADIIRRQGHRGFPHAIQTELRLRKIERRLRCLEAAAGVGEGYCPCDCCAEGDEQ